MTSNPPIILVTQHGKERVIAPVFAEILDWEVTPVAIDTDQFGTFSGEQPRRLGPEETALAKVRAGLAHSGEKRGLASEGSIGPDPRMPLLIVDQELLVYLDEDQGVSLTQSHTSPDIVAYRHVASETTSWEDVARKADLPHHAVIVANTGETVSWVRKGLRDIDEVSRAVWECQRDTGVQAVIETDYRAMVCPSRQRVIGQCAELLAHRLATPCPMCAAPGWGVVSYEYGLPCRGCGGSVGQARRAEIWSCVLCAHTDSQTVATEVDPTYCPVCNP